MDSHHNTQELGIGWLYAVTHANAQGLVKIGITDRPERRMEELGRPTVLARVPVRHPRRHEQHLHQKYQAKRVPQTEWFSLDEQELADLFQHLHQVARPFLDLIVLPAVHHEPEPEVQPEPLPESEPTAPDRRIYLGKPPHPDRWGEDQPRVSRIEDLRRKLGIERWRAEMLIEHGLEHL